MSSEWDDEWSVASEAEQGTEAGFQIQKFLNFRILTYTCSRKRLISIVLPDLCTSFTRLFHPNKFKFSFFIFKIVSVPGP
jgi:hypothetical protein